MTLHFPKPRPTNHFVAMPVDPEFAKVVLKAADESGRSFAEQLLVFCKNGAACARTHTPPAKTDLGRKRK